MLECLVITRENWRIPKQNDEIVKKLHCSFGNVQKNLPGGIKEQIMSSLSKIQPCDPKGPESSRKNISQAFDIVRLNFN